MPPYPPEILCFNPITALLEEPQFNHSSSRASTFKMNTVDFLLGNQFKSLPLRDRNHIINLGKHKPQDIVIKQTVKGKNRYLNVNLFNDCEWLTASESNESMYCFYCLLFGGEETWTKRGFRDISHVQQAIKTHSLSKTHISNSIFYKTFGKTNVGTLNDASATVFTVSSRMHNEEVKRNRRTLSKIIDCFIFCVEHELAQNRHDESSESLNRFFFLDLLKREALTDCLLQEHLNSGLVDKYISTTGYIELLNAMYSVYFEHLQKDVKECPFLSVQVDEASFSSSRCQFAIVLRYIKDNKPIERFLKFLEIKDGSAVCLATALAYELIPFDVKEKLISHTFDGAVVSDSVSNVQSELLKWELTNTVFVHCYTHPLSLIVKQACSRIVRIKIFFAKVSGFSSFLDHFSKSNDLLNRVIKPYIQGSHGSPWNSDACLLATLYSSRNELQKCLETILEQKEWDDMTIKETSCLLSFLCDPAFLFFVEHFNTIFALVDILFIDLHQQSASNADDKRFISTFLLEIQNLRDSIIKAEIDVPHKVELDEPHKVELDEPESVESPKRKRICECTSKEAVMKECCDIICAQVEDRFANFDTMRALNIVDPMGFKEFKAGFPTEMVSLLEQTYSMINGSCLRAELDVIYSGYENEMFGSAKFSSIQELYTFILAYDLKASLPQTSKVLEIALTTPSSAVKSGKTIDNLKRIKSFSKSTVRQGGLDALAFLNIHKDVISTIDDFKDKVIDSFASSETKKLELLYR